MEPEGSSSVWEESESDAQSKPRRKSKRNRREQQVNLAQQMEDKVCYMQLDSQTMLKKAVCCSNLFVKVCVKYSALSQRLVSKYHLVVSTSIIVL